MLFKKMRARPPLSACELAQMGLSSHFLSVGRANKRYFVVRLLAELNYVPEDAFDLRYPSQIRFYRHWYSVGVRRGLVSENSLRMRGALSFVFAGTRGRKSATYHLSFGGQKTEFDLVELIVRNRDVLERGNPRAMFQELLHLRTAEGSICRLSVTVRECGFREAQRIKYGRQAAWGVDEAEDASGL